MHKACVLELPALEIQQGPQRTIYSFAVDGKLLPRFTAIDRLGRGDEHELKGYQRPEVLSHIAEIRTYVESENPMIPNALVVAFDKRVCFEPLAARRSAHGASRHGILRIPVDDRLPEHKKPGWIVDGQQRTAAIRDARVERFPICVTAFIAAGPQEQREQFILVNSTKPLPKGLVYELLPQTGSRLPAMLQRRRFPAALLDTLNHNRESPLCGLVHTPTNPEGVIKDNSLLRMIENSLSDGLLYRVHAEVSSTKRLDCMCRAIGAFWSAVAVVFPEAWGISPRRSRLMHGVGIVSLGFVMDAIAERLRGDACPSAAQFRDDLYPLRDVCRWTAGYWDFGPGQQRKWNELQNTTRDIQLLANYLLVQYKRLVWNRSR